jgi:hypothetical protein
VRALAALPPKEDEPETQQPSTPIVFTRDNGNVDPKLLRESQALVLHSTAADHDHMPIRLLLEHLHVVARPSRRNLQTSSDRTPHDTRNSCRLSAQTATATHFDVGRANY